MMPHLHLLVPQAVRVRAPTPSSSCRLFSPIYSCWSNPRGQRKGKWQWRWRSGKVAFLRQISTVRLRRGELELEWACPRRQLMASATQSFGHVSASQENIVSLQGEKEILSDLMEPQEEDEKSNESKRKFLKLEQLNWDDSFVRELPGDSRTDGPPRQVLHACYTKVSPSAPVDNPQLVVWSNSVADLLNLDPKEFKRPDFPLVFSGASPLKGSVPYAQCYGGHQFGMWAGQLGDGRAITLGEVLNDRGERWELQLKGAGKTPYSRFADGLAVLRSSIREFLCSEAMDALGVPTTRALCLVTTGKDVMRDMFYDGNPKEEPGAIVCRVAQSFLRFGSYQIHALRGEEDVEIVRTLLDYTIRHHFPHLDLLSSADEDFSLRPEGLETSTIDLTSNKYAAWFCEVAERTAVLIAKWQGVGFTHGVMNTDNMSVLGLTIDYGPFGFLDAFDPKYTPNTTDLPGRRYCFANQPDVGMWNLAQLASTLSTANLINDEEAKYAMAKYGARFMDEYQSVMTKKLGLEKYNKDLISKLLTNMAIDKVDYTICFRALSNIKTTVDLPDDELLSPLKAVLLDSSKERKKAWIDWLRQYTHELASSRIPDEESLD
uniref:Selenoprotein O n=1 Tax=Wollemia nobilis TaxID=56998 RepID=A0A0C9RMU2_9CONI